MTLQHHAYAEPYNRFRRGDVFEQKLEPYLDCVGSGPDVSILTLFRTRQGQSSENWEETSDWWSCGSSSVSLSSNELTVTDGPITWCVQV